MGGNCYIYMNNAGTLQKLPKIKWYWQLFFAFKSAFRGGVSVDEVRKKAIRSKIKYL